MSSVTTDLLNRLDLINFTEDVFSAFVSVLPKSEIHIHCEAVVSVSSYLELNKRYKIDESLIDENSFKRLLDMNNLSDMIKNFIYLQSFFKKETDFDLLIKDLGNYAERNNIKYMEIFFSPSMFRKFGLDPKLILSIMDKGFDSLRKDKGIDIFILVDVSRTFGFENAMINLNMILEYRSFYPGTRVIGIGLGGTESGHPASDYSDVFAKAINNNLKVVAHAGEEVDSTSIWSALKDLDVMRIGHGTSAVYDNELMEYLAKNKIPLEICLTSNLITKKYVQKMSEHPIKDFMKNNIPLTINTDDPILFNTELNTEIGFLFNDLKFTVGEIFRILENNFKYSFLTAVRKEQYISDLYRKADEFLKESINTAEYQKI